MHTAIACYKIDIKVSLAADYMADSLTLQVIITKKNNFHTKIANSSYFHFSTHEVWATLTNKLRRRRQCINLK